jgi:hypothetical protein
MCCFCNSLFQSLLPSSHLIFSILFLHFSMNLLFLFSSLLPNLPHVSSYNLINKSHHPSSQSIPAQFSTVEVVKLLYAAYPAATHIDHDNYKRNVIHNGIYNNTDPAMMDYLCVSFPDALQGFSQDRYVRT